MLLPSHLPRIVSPLRYFCSKQCPFSNYSLTKMPLFNEHILPYVCTPKGHGYTKITIDHARMFMNLFFPRTSQLQDHPIFFPFRTYKQVKGKKIEKQDEQNCTTKLH